MFDKSYGFAPDAKLFEFRKSKVKLNKKLLIIVRDIFIVNKIDFFWENKLFKFQIKNDFFKNFYQFSDDLLNTFKIIIKLLAYILIISDSCIKGMSLLHGTKERCSQCENDACKAVLSQLLKFGSSPGILNKLQKLRLRLLCDLEVDSPGLGLQGCDQLDAAEPCGLKCHRCLSLTRRMEKARQRMSELFQIRNLESG
jgi:hypothetical protein